MKVTVPPMVKLTLDNTKSLSPSAHGWASPRALRPLAMALAVVTGPLKVV